MRTVMMASGALALTALVWTGARAQVSREPSAGSGVVTVAGRVEVVNTPSVSAGQLGEWKVAVANAPDVHVANTPAVVVASPNFVKTRRRYDVIWPNGDRELVTVEQTGRDGWVRVDTHRWINVTAARSLEEKP